MWNQQATAPPERASAIVQTQTQLFNMATTRRRRGRVTSVGARPREHGSVLATVPKNRPDWLALTGNARQVYTAIEGACSPEDRANRRGWRTGSITRKEIAEEVGRSLTTVRNAIEELVERDWIRVSKSGGRVGRRQSYVILKHSDPAQDVNPGGSMPFPVWLPEEMERRRLRIISNQAARERIAELEAVHERALESGDIEAARSAFSRVRELRDQINRGRGQGDFFGPSDCDLTSQTARPEVAGATALGSKMQNLSLCAARPEAPSPTTTGSASHDPILFPSGSSKYPSLSPAPSTSTHESEGAPTPVAMPEGEGGFEPKQEPESNAAASAMPERQADQPESLADAAGAGEPRQAKEKETDDEPRGWGEPGCPDCQGTGFMGSDGWDVPCNCVVRAAEARRVEAEAGTVHESGLGLMGAARNERGEIASADELADRTPDEMSARSLAPAIMEAFPGPESALVVRGDGRGPTLAALAVLETKRRAGARVLALNDAEARQEDLEKEAGSPGPVALGRTNGLGVLLLEMTAKGSHEKWDEKLIAFVRRARNQGAALIVVTSMGPEQIARIHGPELVTALGGPEAWKEAGV